MVINEPIRIANYSTCRYICLAMQCIIRLRPQRKKQIAAFEHANNLICIQWKRDEQINDHCWKIKLIWLHVQHLVESLNVHHRHRTYTPRLDLLSVELLNVHHRHRSSHHASTRSSSDFKNEDVVYNPLHIHTYHLKLHVNINGGGEFLPHPLKPFAINRFKHAHEAIKVNESWNWPAADPHKISTWFNGCSKMDKMRNKLSVQTYQPEIQVSKPVAWRPRKD